MLDQVLHAILQRFAAVWRVFGSPRIVGDEKAASAVKSALSDVGRAGEVGAGWSTRTRRAVIASSGVLVAVVIIWALLASRGGDDEAEGTLALASPTPFSGPQFMTEIRSLEFALAAARESGLVSEEVSHASRRIQFGEYAQAIGEQDRAERGLLETPSDTEVWAVAFSGDVEIQLASGDRVEYDNLTVVLDALTGTVYRVEAFFGDYESEARAPAWLRPPTPTPAPTPTATARPAS